MLSTQQTEEHSERLEKIFNIIKNLSSRVDGLAGVVQNVWLGTEAWQNNLTDIEQMVNFSTREIKLIKGELERVSDRVEAELANVKQILESPNRSAHIWYKCQNCTQSGCPFCDGGLKYCIVCKCAESELTTDCFGEPLTEELKEEVTKHKKDFQDGEWVNLI